MGLYDRDYTQSEFRQQRFGLPQMRFNFPRVTPVVKWLLIVNFAVFVLCLVGSLGDLLHGWFAVDPRSWPTTLQPWRLIGYQFLHSRESLWHIVGNMLTLYFLGHYLERSWGSRKFLTFYLICGAAGGIVFSLLVRVGFLAAGPMVGASGAVLGVIAACAILFPHIVLVLFVFPVPIRLLAVLFALNSFFVVLFNRGLNPGGEAAHFAGMAMGAAYVLLGPRWDKFSMKRRAGSWEKRLEDSRRLQVEVDRILAKVHRSGLHSLTSVEKRTLKRATQVEIKRHQL
ncbi:MAG TPA: rhomboid family intramembrane serine protease [Sedimentisphaerales bacterium]|nr:rhomboid family intramembrane serine protease [Sedimentisphaerales bacterium]